MDYVTDVSELETVYGAPGEASLIKVAKHMTPSYRKWIMASRLCILSTVGPDCTDGSPRGDDGPVVRELDQNTLAMPDWRGNNRIDSLRNIVADGRVSIMFLVPGFHNVVRVNGYAKVTTDAALCQSFVQKGQHPRSVIVIKISEIYSQCARALLRSDTWSGDDRSAGLPSVGDMLREMTDGAFDGVQYDADWAGRAAKTMW
ncbi:MAG: pyridoxamine 5'-phosphate oxidase family protein [Pseudomonadota bacterium]